MAQLGCAYGLAVERLAQYPGGQGLTAFILEQMIDRPEAEEHWRSVAAACVEMVGACWH